MNDWGKKAMDSHVYFFGERIAESPLQLFAFSVLVPLAVFVVLKTLPRVLSEILAAVLPLAAMVLLMAWLDYTSSHASFMDTVMEVIRVLMVSSWNVIIAIGLFGFAAGYCFFSRTRMVRMGLYLLVMMVSAAWVPMLNLPRIEAEFNWYFLIPSFFAILPFFVIGVHLGRGLRRLVLRVKRKRVEVMSDE